MEKKKILLIGSMHFFLDSCMSFFAIYLVIARLDTVKAALILTFTTFAGNILQPLMGYSADRLRGKFTLFLGMILASVSMSSIGLTRNYILLFFLVLFGQLGSSLFHPAGANVAAAAGITKKEASFALFSTIGTIGFSLSQPLFSAFTKQFGTHNSIFLALPTVLLAVGFVMFSSTEVHGHEETVYLGALKGIIVKRFAPIFFLFLIMVFRTAFVYSLNSFVAKLFEEWGFPRSIYSSANTVFMLSAAGGILLAGNLAHRIRPRTLLVVSLLGFFPFFILFLYYGSTGRVFHTLFYLGLCGFVLHGGYGTNIILGHKIAPEITSTVSGILMGFAWATASFGPTLCAVSGGIFPRMGNLASGLFILSFFPLVASVFAFLLSKEIDSS
jgi:FSR family fosmidomycin resistance protein-like MFS transporter